RGICRNFDIGLRRRRLGFLEVLYKIFPATSQLDKEISHVTALSHFGRKLDDFGVRNESRSAERPLFSRLIVIEADIHPRNTLVGYAAPIEIGAYTLGKFPVEAPS